jgi:hypothetical protein
MIISDGETALLRPARRAGCDILQVVSFLQELSDFFQSKARDPNGFQSGTLSRDDLNLSLADPEPLGKELNEGFVRFSFHRGGSQLHLEEATLLTYNLICCGSGENLDSDMGVDFNARWLSAHSACPSKGRPGFHNKGMGHEELDLG